MRGFCGSVPPHTSAEGGISTAGEFSLNPVTTKLGPEWDDAASQKPQNQKKQNARGHTQDWYEISGVERSAEITARLTWKAASSSPQHSHLSWGATASYPQISAFSQPSPFPRDAGGSVVHQRDDTLFTTSEKRPYWKVNLFFSVYFLTLPHNSNSLFFIHSSFLIQFRLNVYQSMCHSLRRLSGNTVYVTQEQTNKHEHSCIIPLLYYPIFSKRDVSLSRYWLIMHTKTRLCTCILIDIHRYIILILYIYVYKIGLMPI